LGGKLSAVRLRRLSEFLRGDFFSEMRSDYFENTAPVRNLQIVTHMAAEGGGGPVDLTFPDWWNYTTLLEHFLNGTDRLRFAPAERSGAAEFPPHPPSAAPSF